MGSADKVRVFAARVKGGKMIGQFIGAAIFWAAGAAAVYFLLRDDEKTTLKNLQHLSAAMLVLGAMAGFVIYTVALATTGPDRPEYWEEDYRSRR